MAVGQLDNNHNKIRQFFSFRHPYKFELDAFEPRQWQLEGKEEQVRLHNPRFHAWFTVRIHETLCRYKVARLQPTPFGLVRLD